METQATYASFSKRLLAHNIDLLPIILLLYLITFLSVGNHPLIISGSVYFLYNFLFELSPMRATPGKKLVGLYVSSCQATFLSQKILLRNLLKPVSLIAFFSGFVMIQLSRKRQALHDYIAGTIVLFKED